MHGATDDDTSDEYLAAAIGHIERLWAYAKYRDQAFRDLLGAVEVSLRGRVREQFTINQRTAVIAAMRLLQVWLLEKEDAEKAIDSIIDSGIDLLVPVKPTGDTKVRIVLEFLGD